MSYSIALVEDEENLRLILKTYLQNKGWEITEFADGISAMEHAADSFHLWILDIMLPGVDGYSIIDKIKATNPTIPVIFISARDRDTDRIVGLEMGSDDYLAKPFLPKELVLRVEKLLKRTYNQKASNTIRLNEYILDMETRSVEHHGDIIDLSSREFDLLCLFTDNVGRVFTRQQILDEIWGMDYFGSDRVVDDLVRRLRKRMMDLNLETVYATGYRLLKQK